MTSINGTIPEMGFRGKFTLLFKTIIKVDETKINVRALSVFVIVVYGETMAWAQVTWENSFANLTSVSWERMKYVLKSKFYSKTGTELSDVQLSFS